MAKIGEYEGKLCVPLSIIGYLWKTHGSVGII